MYKVDGPQPGAVAGIVLGSVAGFILLIVLLQSLSGNAPSWTITGENEGIAVLDRNDRGRRRSRRSDRSDRIDVQGQSPRFRTVIVEETGRKTRMAQNRELKRNRNDNRRISKSPRPIRRVAGDEDGSSIIDMPARISRRRRSSGYELKPI